MAGSFCQAYASGDDRFKNAFTEEISEVSRHLTGEVGAVIEHGKQDAFDFQWMIEGFANALDGVHQLGNTFQGEELALDRNEHGIGSDQSVQREEVEGWWTVDQEEVVFRPDGGYLVVKAKFAPGGIDQFQICADQVFVARDEVETFESGAMDGLFKFDIS